MKKLFVMVIMMMTLSLGANAQVTRNGNVFTSAKASSKSETAEKTQFFWADSKGEKYPIYISKSGSCFVIRVSKKSGKEYKSYLDKEISMEVCKALGRTYKGK